MSECGAILFKVIIWAIGLAVYSRFTISIAGRA